MEAVKKEEKEVESIEGVMHSIKGSIEYDAQFMETKAEMKLGYGSSMMNSLVAFHMTYEMLQKVLDNNDQFKKDDPRKLNMNQKQSLSITNKLIICHRWSYRRLLYFVQYIMLKNILKIF